MSSLTFTVQSTNYSVLIDSLDLPDRIEERSRCKVRVDTDLTVTFTFGQRVTVTDSVLGLLFFGIINTDDYERLHPQDRLRHDIDCIDCVFDVDRLTSDEQYANQYAGIIVADQHQRHLAAEGITAAYALDIDTERADFAMGTLSNVVATTTEDGAGCLELASAGVAVSQMLGSVADFSTGTLSSVVASNDGLMLASRQGIKITGLNTSNPNNATTNSYSYYKIWSGSYSIVSGDHLQYFMWIDGSSPAIQSAVDGICTDGSSTVALRDFSYSSSPIKYITDQNHLRSHPNTNLTGWANNKWYFRDIDLTPLAGKTLKSVMVAFEGDKQGTYTSYFYGIVIVNGSTTKLVVYSGGALQSSSQAQQTGYSSFMISTPTVYDRTGYRISTAASLAGVGVIRDSQIDYSESAPGGTAIAHYVSIDNGATYRQATNAQALPSLLSGADATLFSVKLLDILTITGNDPTISPTLLRVAWIVNPSYVATKHDLLATYNSASNFNTGTYSNTAVITAANAEYDWMPYGVGQAVLLNGSFRNWDDETLASQSVFGNAGIGEFAYSGQLQLNVNSGSDVRSKFTFAGTWADFIASIDIQVVATGNENTGIIYRTTNWVNPNECCAYTVEVYPTQMMLVRGPNTGTTGSRTVLVTLTGLSLQAGSWHTLKLVISGSSHQIYLDEVLMISAIDATYTGAGYLGARAYCNTGSPGLYFFDNFGVVAALSGTWISPSIDLSSVGIVGSSLLQWDNATLPLGCSILVEANFDSGGYQFVANGGAIPGLSAGTSVAGKSLLLRFTLTAGIAAYTPAINSIMLFVSSQYSSSGYRIAPALSLTQAVRAGSTLVAWNATVVDGTTLSVATSPTGSGSWTNVASGGEIAGITSERTPVFDTFDADSSGGYISTCRTGGAVGTWLFDVANSRVSVSGGTNAALLYTTSSHKDVDLMLDLDQADQAGLVWRWQDGSNFYELDVADASASTAPNTVKLYKVVANSKTQIGSTATISFVRGAPHRLRLTCIGTAITVSLDGTTIISVTDSALTSAGFNGIFTGTGIGRFYNLRILALGDDLSTSNAYTQTTLTSIDPSKTPRLLDLTLAALSPDIGIGTLIPNTDARNKHIDKLIGDLVSASPDFYTNVRPDKSLVFRKRQADPAPWILTGDDTMIVDGPRIAKNGDNYRNRQILENVSATISFSDRKTGDGSTRSWSLKYKLASAPTVLLNGQPQTVAAKNTTTADFYYEIGSETLAQADSGVVLAPDVDFLDIAATGQTTTTVTRNNTGQFPGTISQSDFATITSGGTGIVTDVEDGTGMNVDQAETYADGLLQQWGKVGRSISFETKRSGLKAGQYLPVINPKILLNDAALLITSVALKYWASATNTTFFTIDAVEGPNAGSWAKVIQTALGKPTRSGVASASQRRRRRGVATTVLYSPSATYTSNGNTADLPVGDYLELAIDVNVTAKSGTSPTLQLVLERKGADGAYYAIWTSSSITATGLVSVSVGAGMTTAQSFGMIARLKWVLGGTTPSWTFPVSIIGK